MKDTIITAGAKKRELTVLFYCFIAANLINLVSVVLFDTRWIELVSQMGYVVCVTVILYMAVFVFRRLFRLFFRKSRDRADV